MHYASQLDRVDTLAELASPFRNVTTRAVLDELTRSGVESNVLSVGWPELVPVDDLAHLDKLVEWTTRVGRKERNRGEATVLAWCEVERAIAITDDREAKTVGLNCGVEVHGTLWVFAQAVKAGKASELGLAGLIDSLRAAGSYLPCSGSSFPAWARRNGVLRD